MRKLYMVNPYNFASNSKKRTLGSETSQYQVEKKLIKYFVSSGERTRSSPNQHVIYSKLGL